MKIIAVLSIGVATCFAAWDYSWPYGVNNTCECQEFSIEGDLYETEAECLEAYANDEYQWCYHNGVGITASQCTGVVTIAEGVTNDMCGGLCIDLVAGQASYEVFAQSCKFNFYADFEDEVAVGWSSCFSNYVYGWSDYDPSNSVQSPPLRLLPEVLGPTMCQSLCQAHPDCAYWIWRAYPDEEGNTGNFQNAPLTCLLYDQAYIDGVLSTDMPTDSTFANPTPYCNFDAVSECMVDVFNRPSVNLLQPYSCLLCGCTGKCAWQSPYHLSGPAFCPLEFRNECAYKRPTWTTTLPPCEPETETTLDLETTSGISSETTIELDSSAPETTTTTITLESMESTTTIELITTGEVMFHVGTSTSTTPPTPTPTLNVQLTGTATTRPLNTETTTEVVNALVTPDTLATALTSTATTSPVGGTASVGIPTSYSSCIDDDCIEMEIDIALEGNECIDC
eukprot:Blabericola_migrator_1__5149@NODE_2659_length_2488_cov_402_197439_g1665_i0_p1_GENE_NODE_2659_length_2488_cov_402_197439_g1665_i0NODE_2659_length_2488_cov_402_197439_g1665_i0_p1_ORF_typecomplete_len452_score30_53PAN_4/PF14295_6/1_8e04PAN_4/PF14295_6/9_1e05PAN_4/PF14295_6/1_5e04_NODE_2659_length_2488_cov_402_197439_g1665_i04231778